ncbi:glutaredoxin family protein [Aliidiomarina celeris]|uniref:glutaredoxin family protein n=1 Tax=Aliidiomarina celeris TaxID=2249428 RepID=UPI000DE959FE|nr:glutaredoxin family protein [Aliidiomarina celeris]
MNEFYLLTKDDCGLCKVAITQLYQTQLDEPISLHMVDITQDPALLLEYGAIVPVLVRAHDDAELKWPFEAEKLKDFLTA